MKSKLSKGKQRLLDYLGKPYVVKVIDLEVCIYLDMGTHDIEISMGKTVNSPFNIYVWNKADELQIVERHIGIKNELEKIKELLDDIRTRYSVKKGG